jgi:hypothetical protein
LSDRGKVGLSVADLGSGSGMNSFQISYLGSRILDPEGKFFGEIFLNYLKNPCSFLFLLIRLAPETIRSKKKVRFIFNPSVYEKWDPRSGLKTIGIQIRDPERKI